MLTATALADRFDRALLYATHVHGGQVRKGTSIPYVAHLLAVAATCSNMAVPKTWPSPPFCTMPLKIRVEMFLDRQDEARPVYPGYRVGKAAPERTWQSVVREEFAAMRQYGLSDVLMDEIEKDLTDRA